MRKNKGSATLITILVTAVIITIAIGFNWFVREYLKNAEAMKKKTEAMLKVYSTFDVLNYLILTGLMTNKELKIQKMDKLNFYLKELPINGEDFRLLYDDVFINLQDSNGLISLQSINEEAIKRLVKNVTPKNPDILIESYYDWIDTDDLKRLLGAEKEDYKREKYSYGPRNYPLQYKTEMMLIKNFDEKIYKYLAPYITILPISGFNPNTAPKEVLIAVLDIDEELALKLKNYINNIKPIQNEEELFILIGKAVVLGEEFDFKPSGFLEIKIQNIEKDTITYEINTGLRKTGNFMSPYTIIYWREE